MAESTTHASPAEAKSTLSAAWVAFRTIVLKEIRRFLRIWPQTLVPPAISMVLYFLIFGTFIGSRVGQMGGLDYMAFIVPGLIMMSVITNAYSNVASSFYSTKFQRSIETMLVAPIPNGVILAGFVAGGGPGPLRRRYCHRYGGLLRGFYDPQLCPNRGHDSHDRHTVFPGRLHQCGVRR